jgi:hypothetical protein
MQKYSISTHNQFLQLVLSECLEYVHLNDIIFYYKHQQKKIVLLLLLYIYDSVLFTQILRNRIMSAVLPR